MAEVGAHIKPPEPLQKPLESRYASVVRGLPRRLSESDTVPLQDVVATASNQLTLRLLHRLAQDRPLDPITDPLKAKKLHPQEILDNDQKHRDMIEVAKKVGEDPKLWSTVDQRIDELRKLMVELYKSGKPKAQIILDERPLMALLMALEPKNRDAFYFDMGDDGLKHIIKDSAVASTVFNCFPDLFQDSGVNAPAAR